MARPGSVRKLISPSFWHYVLHAQLKSFDESTGAIPHLGSCGAGLSLDSSASIKQAHLIHIGDRVRIGDMCCIWAGDTATITLGDDTLLGPAVTIFSSNHRTTKGEAIRNQPFVEADVWIGAGCWLGAGVRVMPGVRIADGTVVAAGAVVTKDTKPDSIVGGVPAREIDIRR